MTIRLYSLLTIRLYSLLTITKYALKFVSASTLQALKLIRKEKKQQLQLGCSMLQHLRASEAVEDLNAKKPFKFIIILCICTKLLNYVDYLCMHFALLLFIYLLVL